ncbi:hypothetical protein LZ31DRAFT_79358 [Colletotrichum somersetense]|nr:hypothetical protein LZ31DRAFT_79358 [Colletotrichum somersetense]
MPLSQRPRTGSLVCLRTLGNINPDSVTTRNRHVDTFASAIHSMWTGSWGHYRPGQTPLFALHPGGTDPTSFRTALPIVPSLRPLALRTMAGLLSSESLDALWPDHFRTLILCTIRTRSTTHGRVRHSGQGHIRLQEMSMLNSRSPLCQNVVENKRYIHGFEHRHTKRHCGNGVTIPSSCASKIIASSVLCFKDFLFPN